jgi:excisionase family DNA binding protein
MIKNVGLQPLGVSVRDAGHVLNCGRTRIYDLLDQEELESYMDGSRRKIIYASIEAYVDRRRGEQRTRDVSRAVQARKRKRDVSRAVQAKRAKRLARNLTGSREMDASEAQREAVVSTSKKRRGEKGTHPRLPGMRGSGEHPDQPLRSVRLQGTA